MVARAGRPWSGRMGPPGGAVQGSATPQNSPAPAGPPPPPTQYSAVAYTPEGGSASPHPKVSGPAGCWRPTAGPDPDTGEPMHELALQSTPPTAPPPPFGPAVSPPVIRPEQFEDYPVFRPRSSCSSPIPRPTPPSGASDCSSTSWSWSSGASGPPIVRGCSPRSCGPPWPTCATCRGASRSGPGRPVLSIPSMSAASPRWAPTWPAGSASLRIAWRWSWTPG